MRIPFNKPYFTGNETKYIEEAVKSGHISGNGSFTKKCQSFFEKKFSIKKVLLTKSCTSALEMCALLINIKPGDEVIMPSYTFVSTANAFTLRGANIILCDSRKDHPGIDETAIEELITDKTVAIVPVHYAGVACDMEKIMSLAAKYNLFVVEDAAQAIGSYFTFSDGTKKALGSIGHLAAFSFHETKNIISGEGGLLAINEEKFIERAKIIWEKGTNRSAYYRGEVDKYEWVDLGSSFLPSEITAAFLWAQFENFNKIQNQRKEIWNRYYDLLKSYKLKLPIIPIYAFNNAHMFYIICTSLNQRTAIIYALEKEKIQAVFHYFPLHKSSFYLKSHIENKLIQSDFFNDHLLRLPFFYELNITKQKKVCSVIAKELLQDN
ncbi:MAG: dTDP-4-amino-4,6-dideoxygalactose transaminase [Bacteroidetes bacterium]|nr:MAG: dTDP-4-amino-4,6-dideoxygalactose transaminase [Bacteroidota bacterium]MBL1145396.1 dTDP-4-amino-4,6-dideoxygalactose transaminase [Bacteroidota bacterium]NOG58194.1 dTDP-4-amino-4,6-dideoxygalactose transaminase [Bacteroidota bacterium]